MSEPVENLDVEGVLQSVKRLVSAESRNERPGAFVLTNDQRVHSLPLETDIARDGADKTDHDGPKEQPTLSTEGEVGFEKEPVSTESPSKEDHSDVSDGPLGEPEQLAEVKIQSIEAKAVQAVLQDVQKVVDDEGWPDDGVQLEANADPLSEPIIDREELRGIVVEMIHQEMRGELGERITRNVRKLVRREIQRFETMKKNG